MDWLVILMPIADFFVNIECNKNYFFRCIQIPSLNFHPITFTDFIYSE